MSKVPLPTWPNHIWGNIPIYWQKRAAVFGDVAPAGAPGSTDAVGLCPRGAQMPGKSFGGLWLVMTTPHILGILVGTVQDNSRLTLFFIIGVN